MDVGTISIILVFGLIFLLPLGHYGPCSAAGSALVFCRYPV